MAAKPEAKKGGSGLFILLGGGCAVLGLCLICGGAGGAGVWWWVKPAAEKAVKEVVDEVKAKNPVKGTAPVGKASVDELDPETKFWDFSMRLPKGLTITVNDQKLGGPDDTSLYQWTQMGGQGSWMQINVSKLRNVGDKEPVLWFMNVQKFKSGPDDKIQFDTIHMPQPVELNGLHGARSWTLFHMADHTKIMVRYRYHVDGWAYVFESMGLGKTEAEARTRAGLVDVSICTFKKR
jgi:hypothetical protein